MRVLAFFKQPPEYVHFCIAELKSLFALHNIPAWEAFDLTPQQVELVKEKPYLLNKELFPSFPFVYLKNHNYDILRSIMKRSLLVKYFVRVFSEGNNIDELIQNVDVEEIKPFLDESFSFTVDAHNRWYKRPEILEMIDKFAALDFTGKINLNDPQNVFLILEDWENNHVKGNLEYKMRRSYFGLQICKYGKGKDAVNAGYELPLRPYLGPTSTDNDLAFLMANQAMVKENDFVLDPFLGTGSLLIAPSHFGATCFGSEIDARVIHGTKVGRLNHNVSAKLTDKKPDIWLNFKYYGFPMPEVIRLDSSKSKLHCNELFDSILCDPPYGWRASVRVSGDTESKLEKKAKKKAAKEEKAAEEEAQNLAEGVEKVQIEVKEEEKKLEDLEEEEKRKKVEQQYADEGCEYFIATKAGKAEDVIDGLIDLADGLLRVGGRLVFLFPVDKSKLEDKIDLFKVLPAHSNFKLEDYTENVLAMQKSRILVTMIKTS